MTRRFQLKRKQTTWHKWHTTKRETTKIEKKKEEE
jgi:hypothetical protein